MQTIFNERVSNSKWVKKFRSGQKEKFELLQTFRTGDLLDVFEDVKKLWIEGEYREKTLKRMPKMVHFPKRMIEIALDLLLESLSKDNLKNRIRLELGRNYLDGWVREGSSHIYAAPLGILLHVFAGNIFISGIESLVNGLITKNLNLVKTSSVDQFFPYLFLESLGECSPELASTISILSFKGGETAVENKLKRIADAIIVWGSEKAILGYRKNLPLGKKLIEHGPKCGIGVVEKYDPSLPKRIAKDVAYWEQSSCASPQVIYVRDSIDVEKLAPEIGRNLEKHPKGPLEPDQAVEILKAKEVARMGELFGDYKCYSSAEPYEWQIIISKKFDFSPLGRTLYLRKYHSLEDVIEEIPKEYLQTVGIQSPRKKQIAKKFVLAGACRITELGKMTEGTLGAPHEGNYPLRELVRFCNIES
jgi:hypothetical protein